MSRLTLIICAAILVFQIGGCAGQPQLAQTSLCHGAACNADPYIIGPGDVLHIAVWKNTNLDRVVTVRPDGDISFPLLNDIHVVGMTPDKLRISIKSKLAKFMVVPEVSVVVQEVHSFVVSVLGEVKKPGRYEFQSDVTVLDVLAKADGFCQGIIHSHSAGKWWNKRKVAFRLRYRNSSERQGQFIAGTPWGHRSCPLT